MSALRQDLQTAAQAELELRRRFGSSFHDFIANVKPDFKFHRHCEVLIEILELVASGELKRLMVFMPRRYGKSEVISRLFPAYYLFKNPIHHLGIASYGAELAEGLSRDARENYLRTGRELGSAESVSEWHTTEGGRCWSAGVGGAIVGKGGECLISGTMVQTNYGRVPIETIQSLNNPHVLSYGRNGIEYKRIEAVKRSTATRLFRITTRSGRSVTATGNHRFFANGKYVTANSITKGDSLLLALQKGIHLTVSPNKQSNLSPLQRYLLLLGMQPSTPFLQEPEKMSARGASTTEDITDSMQKLSHEMARGKRFESAADIVVMVEPTCQESIVYDLQVEGNRNFFANGILTHNCLILDDPYRTRAEALSLAYRKKTWEWRQAVWYTCQHPHAAFIDVQTRWHADDNIGRLLEEERSSEYPENWHIVNFEALKEEKSQVFPVSCTVSPDWRNTGEALCPDAYSVNDLLRIKSKNIDVWRAMFQQNPQAEEGNIWKLVWFKSYDESTLGDVVLSNDGYDWDLNDGGDREDGENAACAFVRSSIGSDGKIYISDCDFLWSDFAEQVAWMKRIDSPHYVEAKASGKSVVVSLQKSSVYATGVTVRGLDKVSRTKLSTPIASGDHVRIHKLVWEKLLYDDRQGILGFPVKPFKDLNDAFVQALNRHWVFDIAQQSEEDPPEWWHGIGVGNAPPRGADWRDAHNF